MSKSFHVAQWQAMALSILAGLGLGYLLGMFFTKRRLFRRQLHSSITPSTSAADSGTNSSSHDNLRTALNELKNEVEQLRTSVEQSMRHMEEEHRIGHTLSSRALTVATSEFVSAQGEEDDRFYDMDEDEDGEEEEKDLDNASKKSATFQRLDDMGKNTYEDISSCHSLLEELDKLLVDTPEESGLLWRKARVLCHLGSLYEEDKEKGIEFIDQAVEVAQKSVDLDGRIWQNHYWYALAIGSQIRHQSVQKKIVGGFEYKDHLERAVSLKPDEPMLYHYLGRWFYEVAGVSWLERKAAAALYAKPPESTYDEAMDSFMKAEELNPLSHKTNMLMVAKCHMKLGSQASAVEWLEKACRLDNINREDKSSHAEIEALLLQLSSA